MQLPARVLLGVIPYRSPAVSKKPGGRHIDPEATATTGRFHACCDDVRCRAGKPPTSIIIRSRSSPKKFERALHEHFVA